MLLVHKKTVIMLSCVTVGLGYTVYTLSIVFDLSKDFTQTKELNRIRFDLLHLIAVRYSNNI